MPEWKVRLRYVLIALGGFVFLLGFEWVTESEEIELFDLFGEAVQVAAIVATATAVGMLTQRVARQHDEKEGLVRDLQFARAEGAAWRQQSQRYLSGLGEEIERQFEIWGLTTAEREVALLMLKGFNHRDVASLRGTTEATVRHQARAVYQKSGMASRGAFCAYFLEDLLPARAPGAQEALSS